MGFGTRIKEAVEKYDYDMPMPVFDFTLFNISFFVWKKPDFYLMVVETEPYALDGTMPTIMMHVAFLEIMFESPYLYKKIYKRQKGFYPLGLEDDNSKS